MSDWDGLHIQELQAAVCALHDALTFTGTMAKLEAMRPKLQAAMAPIRKRVDDLNRSNEEFLKKQQAEKTT